MMELVRFISQDGEHFAGAMVVMYLLFEGLEGVAKAFRGGTK